jgi:hypothetical protein
MEPTLHARGTSAMHANLHPTSLLLLAACSVAVVYSAFHFAFFCPFTPAVAPSTYVFGTAMLGCMGYAILLARQKKIVAHKEWMTRAYGIGLGIGLVRVVFLQVHYGLGIPATTYMGPGFWGCFVASLALAEVYLRSQRPPAVKKD